MKQQSPTGNNNRIISKDTLDINKRNDLMYSTALMMSREVGFDPKNEKNTILSQVSNPKMKTDRNK